MSAIVVERIVQGDAEFDQHAWDLLDPPPHRPHAGITSALRCLRESVPDALQVLWRLEYRKPQDSRSPAAAGRWAYCISRSGLHHEPVDQWWRTPDKRGRRGWDRCPSDLTTWADLAGCIAADPRRASIAAWAESLTTPDRWLDWYRPYELWPDPASWHPSRFEGDHDRDGWPERLAAWQTTLAILDDAIEAAS